MDVLQRVALLPVCASASLDILLSAAVVLLPLLLHVSPFPSCLSLFPCLPYGEHITYTIYQIKDIRAAPYAFMPYAQAKVKLRMSHYQRAYRGVLAPKVTLDDLYLKHNQDNRPFGQQMHSLSMSDVIVLNRGGEKKAYYVDTVGFQEAKRFLNPPVRKRKPPTQER